MRLFAAMGGTVDQNRCQASVGGKAKPLAGGVGGDKHDFVFGAAHRATSGIVGKPQHVAAASRNQDSNLHQSPVGQLS